MNETQLSLAIREALLNTGRVLLWRNNTGKLQDAGGRWMTFGLGVGSADTWESSRARAASSRSR